MELIDIKQSLQEASKILAIFIKSEKEIAKIASITQLISQSFIKGGKVISCGNGGSMADSMHFAEELTGRFKNDRRPLPAIAISDPTYISCVANDYGYDQVFARYVRALATNNDVLIVFSTSGKSNNIIQACQQAQQQKTTIIGLLGKDGGDVKQYCDQAIVIDSQNTARIQEMHIKIVHIIIEQVEKQLIDANYL